MSGKMKKYLFLDFDGCLNSYEDGSYMSKGKYGPSKRICSMIRKFCEENGCRIIISSNWRKFRRDDTYDVFNGRTVKNPIECVYSEFGDLIDGTLPIVRHVNKSQALIMWFEENNIDENDIRYVVFDDDLREDFHLTSDYGISEHFILVKPEDGITSEDLDKSRIILSREDKKGLRK